MQNNFDALQEIAMQQKQLYIIVDLLGVICNMDL